MFILCLHIFSDSSESISLFKYIVSTIFVTQKFWPGVQAVNEKCETAYNVQAENKF